MLTHLSGTFFSHGESFLSTKMLVDQSFQVSPYDPSVFIVDGRPGWIDNIDMIT